jgi:hypothetical protein
LGFDVKEQASAIEAAGETILNIPRTDWPPEWHLPFKSELEGSNNYG